ncbi:flagellar hook-basal body complex protein [Ornithinibacillus contaminans]|uniref:flagellar hook-basal body complex protein n=1 Tax=Ornithinibacillus contaminans TaxID=694055 RepID=UPI00064DE58E|nr:flagellar hook-basal body complex protein [Ornithinibacillus contaminans]
MLRSMYSGISGMKNFQTKLDVIGNNIANVNTSGFKKGRVTFQDMMSQMTTGAQAPTTGPAGNMMRGGVNPAQVGLGSQLGSIDNIHTQGFRQTTNNPLDFALEGDGMFVLASDLVPGNLENSNVAYTRAGNFYLDEQGNIVNPQGLYLMGYTQQNNAGTQITATDDASIQTRITTVNGETTIEIIHPENNAGIYAEGLEPEVTTDEDNNIIETYILPNNVGQVVVTTAPDGTITVTTPDDPAGSQGTSSELNVDGINYDLVGPINIPENAQSFSVQANGTVNYVDENGNTRVAGQIALANFSNPGGLQKAGSNLFLNSANAGYTGLIIPETEGASVVSGALEMSNVDLSEEFTEMITAQRGFQANTRIITTSDEILQELVNLKR